jgi:RNA polymerase sigma factor (TIGR02999 family)
MSDDTPRGADALFHAMYRELRQLARSRLRRSEHITLLDTTSLVHEAYLRFDKGAWPGSDDRGKFLGYAARVMRFVVVDFVRQRHAERRGGDALHVTLTGDVADSATLLDDDVLRIHEAIDELMAIDERLARVVEMRCFAGMENGEIAQAIGVNERTVRRDWDKARLMLRVALA